MTKQIFFNDCEISKVPSDVSSDFALPRKVVMILNMNDGVLAFRVDSDHTAVAMKGLKRIGEKLYIVGAMNTPGDTLRVKYMGTLGEYNARGQG